MASCSRSKVKLRPITAVCSRRSRAWVEDRQALPQRGLEAERKRRIGGVEPSGANRLLDEERVPSRGLEEPSRGCGVQGPAQQPFGQPDRGRVVERLQLEGVEPAVARGLQPHGLERGEVRRVTAADRHNDDEPDVAFRS